MKERAINPYALWLSSIRGVGNLTIKTLLETASCAEEVYHMTDDEISMCLVDKLKRRGDATGKALSIYFAQERDPFEEAERLRQKGIGFVSIEDDCFPERLRGIPDCPYGIYYIRDLPPDDVPSVAIVGARNCSSYGREQARVFAEKLALNGISVVSGMARGVDGIAGRAAVNAGGRSYAVLGCGVDVVYPEENGELYDILKERGGLISENPPGTKPQTKLFPRRNRLISGLADLVLVIEARRRSGTVITVDSALEQTKIITSHDLDMILDTCSRVILLYGFLTLLLGLCELHLPFAVLSFGFGAARLGISLGLFSSRPLFLHVVQYPLGVAPAIAQLDRLAGQLFCPRLILRLAEMQRESQHSASASFAVPVKTG